MAGAASVLFCELPSEIEVYNALKSDVVNLFRVLREREEELLRAIELAPYSREEYRLAHEPSDDLVEPARR